MTALGVPEVPSRPALRTRADLGRAGVSHAGREGNLDPAKEPHIIERNGTSLSYNWSVDGVGEWGFLGADRAGLMPLSPPSIQEEIHRMRNDIDCVAVALDPALENPKQTHPEALEFAHQIIDAGGALPVGEFEVIAP